MTALLLLAAAAATVPAADVPIGRWQSATRNGVIEISRCGASICGRLMSSDGIRANADLRDVNNNNANLRTRPLRGVTMLWGFRQSSDGWSGGHIYNPENGSTYTADVTAIDANTLRVRGCIVRPLCKAQTWRRIR